MEIPIPDDGSDHDPPYTTDDSPSPQPEHDDEECQPVGVRSHMPDVGVLAWMTIVSNQEQSQQESEVRQAQQSEGAE